MTSFVRTMVAIKVSPTPQLLGSELKWGEHRAISSVELHDAIPLDQLAESRPQIRYAALESYFFDRAT
jgi:hypothetical protein